MSEHARADPPNCRPLTVDVTNRLEGLPLLRPPMKSDTPRLERERERPPAAVSAAPAKKQARRKDHRPSLVQRPHRRRADYAMIGATLTLRVVARGAGATRLRGV